MGGQQFADGGELLDLRGMNRVLELDMDRGLVRAQGGIQWPDLIRGILELQRDREPERSPRWGIAQKQTGADALTLGGALSANIHGRGLVMGPIVNDVESFTLVNANGDSITCSRTENAELFSLAIGGYGLFGVITEVTLRLTPRRTLRRVVRVIDIEDAVNAAERRINEGFLYGDFQFDIDPRSSDFLTKGVFSGYAPVEGDPDPPLEQARFRATIGSSCSRWPIRTSRARSSCTRSTTSRPTGNSTRATRTSSASTWRTTTATSTVIPERRTLDPR